MSTCISSHGEYDAHETDPDTYVCKWCHEFDETGAMAEIARLRRGPVAGMEHAADRLAEIQTRADNATDGPWDGDYGHFGTGIVAGRVRTGPNVIGSMWRPSDGTFTAHARADVPRLVAALHAALDLHKAISEEGFDVDVCERCSNTAGADAAVSWPCLTVRAIENKLKEGQ